MQRSAYNKHMQIFSDFYRPSQRKIQNKPSQSVYLRISPHTENISESALTKRKPYFRSSLYKENISEAVLTKRIFKKKPSQR
jgi:hypothetical protein